MNSTNMPIADGPAAPLTLVEAFAASAKTGFGFFGSLLKSSGGKRGRRKRVLLLESDSISHLILREALESASLEVEVASNASEALPKLSEAGLDAILMDLSIGGLRGSELIAKARQCPGFAQRPIYVFTCRHPGWSDAPVPGATKVFNKLSISARQVVAALAEQLTGAREGTLAPKTPDQEKASLQVLQEVPRLIQETVSGMQAGLRMLMEKNAGELGCGRWQALRAEVGFLVSSLAVADRREAARLSAALEAFLDELPDDPDEVAEPAWRTAASALEMIDKLGADPASDPENSPLDLQVVLVAEVMPELRSRLNDALVNAGLKPTWFAHPPQALAHLESHSADLLILDVESSNAGCLAKKIRELSTSSQTAVLVASSRTETGGASKAIALTATAEVVLRALLLVEKSRLSNSNSSLPHPDTDVSQTAPVSEYAPETGSDGSDSPAAAAVPEPAPDSAGFSPELPDAQSPSGAPLNASDMQAPNSPAGDTPNPAAASTPASSAGEGLGTAASLPSRPMVVLDLLPSVPKPSAASQPAGPEAKTEVEAVASSPVSSTGEGSGTAGPISPGQDVLPEAVQPALPPGAAPQPGAPSDTAAKFEKERQELLERIVQDQRELHTLRARLERQSEIRKQLENELEGTRTDQDEWEKRLAEQARSLEEKLQSNRELQSQMEAARAELESARAGKDALEKRLAEQALSLQEKLQSKHELQSQMEAARAALESARIGKDELEKRLAEQARKLEESLRLRSDLESALAAARAAVEQANQGRNEVAERCARLEQEITSLRQASMPGAMARITAELERERGERQRAEHRAAHQAGQLQHLHAELSEHLELERHDQDRLTELEQKLRASERALGLAHEALQQESSGRQLAEEQVRGLADSSSQLEKTLSLLESARAGFQRTRQDLETRLQAALSTASDSEVRLQKESVERRRLAEELEAVQAKLQQESRTNALEIARLRSDLELEGFERKRLETDLQRYQQSATESTRAGAAQINRLRRQVRQHVQELRQTSCGLLQAELPDEPKKVVEALLENVISIETVLQECEGPGTGAGADKQAG